MRCKGCCEPPCTVMDIEGISSSHVLMAKRSQALFWPYLTLSSSLLGSFGVTSMIGSGSSLYFFVGGFSKSRAFAESSNASLFQSSSAEPPPVKLRFSPEVVPEATCASGSTAGAPAADIVRVDAKVARHVKRSRDVGTRTRRAT